MHGKAVLFGDTEIAAQILQTSSPSEIKGLGRKVRGFKEKTWEKHRVEIMYEHNLAKFSQNDHLKAALLGTGTRTMVEASPSDRIWGIGLHERKARGRAPATWPGQNLLGQVLDCVRETLREEEERQLLLYKRKKKPTERRVKADPVKERENGKQILYPRG